jgi:hypothetical protein
MDIKIPKVIQRVDMGGYSSALSGRHVCVWVNPTLAILREHDEIVKAGDDTKAFAWYAKVFSQDEDVSTHWTAAELEAARETDPSFWGWLVRAFWDARGEHVSKKKPS